MKDGARRLRDLPRRDLALVALVAVVGLLVRLHFQAGRSFAYDEAGTLLYIPRSYRYILTHFDTWLSMNFYIALLKALSEWSPGSAWALVTPSLLAGVAVVPLTAAFALRFAAPSAAPIAALLAAGNPFLIFYSVQIRSYMLFTAFWLAAAICFSDWCETRRWRHGVGCAACGAVALLLHPNASYFLAVLGVWFLLWFFRESRLSSAAAVAREAMSLALPMAVALAATGAAYVPLLESIQQVREWMSSPAPASIDYLPASFRQYFASGFWALPTLALLALGLWKGPQHSPQLAALGIALALPVALASWLGVSWYPWVYARYLIGMLPPLLVFVAAGVAGVAHGRRTLAAALGLLLVATWLPTLGEHYTEKRDFPFSHAAKDIASWLLPSDCVVCGDPMLRSQLGVDVDAARFTQPRSYLQHDPDRAGPRAPGDLLFVSAGPPIETSRPQRRYGRIQVVRYAEASPHENAEALLRELRASAGERVDPRLTDHYRLVLDLLGALSHPEARDVYTTLYWASRMQTESERLRPPQLLSRGEPAPPQ